LLDRLSAQHVLILGDLILDEYVSGESSRISPEAPVAIVRVEHSRTVLGGAGNTAANVTALGGRATLIGLCGDDEAGEQFRSLARGQNIDFRPVGDGRPTTRKTRVIGHHQQLLRLDREMTRSVSPEIEGWLLGQFLEALFYATIVVLFDYAKGVLTERLC
jgi:rfaE bifunctional protein kinase chain/domain